MPPPGRFLTRMGHGLGHLGVQEMGTSEKVAKVKEKHRFPAGKRCFCGCGGWT